MGKAIISGERTNVDVSVDSSLKMTDTSSGLSIARGNVTGQTFIHEFGNAPDFDTDDLIVTVWDGADDAKTNQMKYVYSTTADIDSISSNKVADTGTIRIEGLGAGYIPVTQTVTLSGTSKVSLTTTLIRVFKMTNTSTTSNVGYIYCYVTTAITSGVPNVGSYVRGIIRPLNNQTLMAIFTVPAGKTGYMSDWYSSTAGANKTSNYIITLRARPFGETFQVKHISSMSDTAAGYIQYTYQQPEVFTEKTDVEMQAQITAAGITEATVTAGFDVVIVDN